MIDSEIKKSIKSGHKLPCVKCITLPICKATARQEAITRSIAVLVVGNILTSKCKLIEDYLIPNRDDQVAPFLDMGRVQILFTYLIEGILK